MPDEAISVATLATSTLVRRRGLEAGRFWPLAFHAVIDSFSRAIISCGTKYGEGSKQIMVYKRLARVGREEALPSAVGMATCTWRERALASLAQGG